MNTKVNRNPADVIDQMIQALGDTKPTIVPELLRVKSDSFYRAPEAQKHTWEELQHILHDHILSDTPQEEFSDEQKAVIRIFTNNPNAI